jgi:uncharacterized protein YlxW (UPF0749 family)
MTTRTGQLALFAFAVVFGFLVVVQYRAQAEPGGLADLSAADLTTLIANLNTRNGQLAAEQATLQARLADLRAAGSQHTRVVASLRDELSRVRRWAGLDPVTGRGVRITVVGPIRAAGINDLLNELRSAGAEAIAIEDVRVTASDVVADLPDGLAVGDRTLPPSITVSAIGNAQVLTAALTRVGGIIGRIQVSQPEVTIGVAPADDLTLPATRHPAGGAPSATLRPHA